jgi:hypothetical protein
LPRPEDRPFDPGKEISVKKQPKKPAKLVLSKETITRIDLEAVQGGRLANNVRIIETDTPSECFC